MEHGTEGQISEGRWREAGRDESRTYRHIFIDYRQGRDRTGVGGGLLPSLVASLRERKHLASEMHNDLEHSREGQRGGQTEGETERERQRERQREGQKDRGETDRGETEIMEMQRDRGRES